MDYYSNVFNTVDPTPDNMSGSLGVVDNSNNSIISNMNNHGMNGGSLSNS